MLRMLLKFLYLKKQSESVFENRKPRITVNITHYHERKDENEVLQKRNRSKIKIEEEL